jgi:hypothetical protein
MENNKIKFDVLDKEEAGIVRAVIDDEFSSIGDNRFILSFKSVMCKKFVPLPMSKEFHIKL